MLVTRQPVFRKFWHAVMPLTELANGPKPFRLLGEDGGGGKGGGGGAGRKKESTTLHGGPRNPRVLNPSAQGGRHFKSNFRAGAQGWCVRC